jgi:hypothetical protein
MWTTLGNLVTHAQAVQMAYNSSQQELEELRAASLEACQEVEEGEVQAGTLPRQAAPKPEDHWAFVPFMFLVLAFKPRDYCNKHLLFKTFECL